MFTNYDSDGLPVNQTCLQLSENVYDPALVRN